MFQIDQIKNASEKIKSVEVKRIEDLLTQSNKSRIDKTIKRTSGYYAFWLVDAIDSFRENLTAADYYIKLSHKKYESDNDHFKRVQFTKDWIDAATHAIHINNKKRNAVCLYVGKTTNLRSRIQGHLKLNVQDIWKNGNKEMSIYQAERLRKYKFGFGKKPNTVSQLRIGIERILNRHSLDFILQNIGLSYIEEAHLENRFYIEDKLVGELYPILNLDGER